MTSGIDLMLARIEVDHGADLAKAGSRELVVYHRRPGGQSQYAAISEMEPQTDRIRKALTFARDHLSEPLSIERLADAACLSVQFGRLFTRETGETPARAVERLRCEAARIRLRDGREPIAVVAPAVGFADVGTHALRLHPQLRPSCLRAASSISSTCPFSPLSSVCTSMPFWEIAPAKVFWTSSLFFHPV